MPSSIKKFIQQQLKENVPLAEIKRDLKEKGYDILQINKAVREAISGVDKKLSNITILQIGILVVGVVIVMGVGVYLTNKTSENIEIPQPTGEVIPSLTRLSPCDAFPTDLNSCQNAVTTVLSSYSGEVLNIIKESDSWKIDVLLFKPLTSREDEQKYNITVFTNLSGDKILRLTV
ncbi:MAG: hypothetical protein HYS80_00215 [Candidatus Aenigmarchaeota archaeon]|nr:hypothetical protein [Candidatus Aenigmarchaeota archaeon]